MQLQNDVSILQKRPTIPIVAQPPAPIPIRNHTVSMLHLCQRRPHVPDLILMRLHPSPERSLGLVMVVVMRVGFQPKHCCLCQQHPLHLRRLDRQRGQVTRRRTVAGVAEVAQGRHRVHLFVGALCRHTLMQCLLVLDKMFWVLHPKKMYRFKDLSLIKIDSLLASAAEVQVMEKYDTH